VAAVPHALALQGCHPSAACQHGSALGSTMLRQALPAVAIGRNPAILASPCGVVIFILFFWGDWWIPVHLS